MRRVWRIREEAEQELAAAVEWYEREHAGLGAALVAEYLATLRWLEEAPSRGTPEPRVPRSLKVYRGRLRRFPYAVVFVELPDAYEVQALVHPRRRPGYRLPRSSIRAELGHRVVGPTLSHPRDQGQEHEPTG